MAFIQKNDPVILNIKLTSSGRNHLALGNLDFKYFVIGDSEIDYNFNNNVQADTTGYTAFNGNILKPLDNNPKIISHIPRKLSGDSYNTITISTSNYVVENSVESLGFFYNSGTTFNIDGNHVKQPDAMIKVSDIASGLSLYLYRAPTYGTSIKEPEINDLLLIKWTMSGSTTGHTVQKNSPTPNLIYRIKKVYTNTGTLATTGVMIDVDRELPDFSDYITSGSSIYAGALIYYDYINFTGDTIFNMSPTDYINESVISFFENSQCPTVIFPFWNLSIIYTDEIAGVQAGNIKYTQFKNKAYGGFVSYIQSQSPIYKKLGIIHYTNSSPANTYGELFYLNTPTLTIPTIMWHKSTSKTLGTKLVAFGRLKSAYGPTYSIDAQYYDLADLDGNVVGKIFVGLKMFVIEDQELLFAMSYKSNRSWTLPNYTINI